MLVGYCRTSLNEDRQCLDLQLDALATAGVDPRHIFIDRASGAKTRRPGLDQMLAFVKSGDVVVAWKFDRISRSALDLIKLCDELRKREVGLRSLTERIDTETPAGQCVMTVLSAMAQLERDVLIERVRAGLDAAAKRGRRGGRPRRMTSEAIAAARSLLSAGGNPTEVARVLGVARSTLVDSLRRTPSKEAGAMAEGRP
jgi:DNA invertase Pin-like site-specific DNA recombinase